MWLVIDVENPIDTSAAPQIDRYASSGDRFKYGLNLVPNTVKLNKSELIRIAPIYTCFLSVCAFFENSATWKWLALLAPDILLII